MRPFGVSVVAQERAGCSAPGSRGTTLLDPDRLAVRNNAGDAARSAVELVRGLRLSSGDGRSLTHRVDRRSALTPCISGRG